MKQNTFEYNKKQTTITYRGCLFHSLVELKYALMIEDTHAYLREGLEIYYEEATQKSTLYIREQTRKYVPDFLIRNVETKEAMLIEIKPDGFDHFELLEKRKRVCEHYIHQHKYDWKFQVVYEGDIVLSSEQMDKFKLILSCHRNQTRLITSGSLVDDYKYRERLHQSVPNLLDQGMSIAQYKFFVKKGIVPTFGS